MWLLWIFPSPERDDKTDGHDHNCHHYQWTLRMIFVSHLSKFPKWGSKGSTYYQIAVLNFFRVSFKIRLFSTVLSCEYYSVIGKFIHGMNETEKSMPFCDSQRIRYSFVPASVFFGSFYCDVSFQISTSWLELIPGFFKFLLSKYDLHSHLSRGLKTRLQTQQRHNSLGT